LGFPQERSESNRLKDEKQANEIEALSKDAAPVSSGERIHVIDVLRGFALFGVLAFNMFFFSGARFELAAWPEALDRAIYSDGAWPCR